MKHAQSGWSAVFFCLGAVLLLFACQTGSADQSPGAVGDKEANAWLARVAAHSQQGEVDQLIEQVVHHWHPKHKDQAWQFVGQLASTLIKWEKKEFGRTKLQTFLGDGKINNPLYIDIGGVKMYDPVEKAASELVLSNHEGHALLARAEKIVIKASLSANIFVSAGSIEVVEAASPNGMFFANDSVALSPFGLIVCDGEFKGEANNCLIIARAGVTCWHAHNSVILSGGPVRFVAKQSAIWNSTVLSTSTVEVPMPTIVKDSVIKQNQPDALGWIKFFDPAKVGLEVEMANDAVRIKKVDPARSFGKGGLQVGDVIVALDKSPVKAVESFRKLLRHTMAGQKAMAFEIRRAEKTLTVSVKNVG